MKFTQPRSEFRNSRTSAAVLLALFTLLSPLAPLFAGTAQAQDARRPATGGSRAGQQPDKDDEQGGEGVKKSPDLAAPSVVTAAQLKVTMDDGVAAGQFKRPGETITYTVTIQNTNTTDDATTVKFLNDLTANANLTFVNGSVQTQPIARNDSFNVLGNVRIDVPAASGLFANDYDADTNGSSGLTVTTAPTTSARGGEVSINTATGAFTYNPPAGYDGADSFSYTVTDATGKTDTATVTLTVAGMIWFINNAATACTSRAAGCGRLSNPFSDLQSFQAAQGGAGTNNGDAVDPEAGDNIFLYTGNSPGTPYTGPLTLLNTQKLIGQGATDTLVSISGVTVPPHSNTLPSTNEPTGTNPTPPTITSAAGGILLASGNTLRGFNVGNVNTAQAKIQGTNFGTLTVGKTSEPDVSLSGTGRMLNLTTGSFAAGSGINSAASTGSSGDAAIFLSGITGAGALSFAGVTVAGAAAEGIEVAGSSSDISFGAVDISAGTDGVSLSNNSAGTRSFGTLTISGGSGIGFRHFDPDGAGAGVGGGTVSVTGAMNVINPTGNGIDIQNSNANLSFAATTVSKGSTSNIGVNLVNNATRTIGFTQLSSTTTNNFALLVNNSGTVNAGGGSLTQNGAGGGAASLTGTALGLTFNSVASTGGVNGLNFSGGSGTFTTASANLQSNTGVGLLMSGSSSVAANFGNTTVNASAADAVDISGQTGNVTFGSLNLSPNSTFRGLDVSNTSGTITSTSGNIATTGAPAIIIAGPAGRTPLAMTLTNVDSTNSTTTGVDLDLVSGNLTVNDPGTATNIQNPTGSGIEVTNSGTGTINFGNTTVNASGNANGDDTGTGIILTTNAGAVSFGALTLTPDSGERGLFATDGDDTAAGAITIGSGTITTTNDTAVEINGRSAAIRTPLNIQLTTVNTTGGGVAANGIRLSNTSATGSPGGFRVLGTGGTCSNANTTGCTGGQITATTGADGATGGNGVRLDDADNVRLTRMRLDTNPNNGIRGINVNTFVLESSYVHGNGNVISGAFHESGVNFDGSGGNGLLGSALINNSDIRNNYDFNLYFDNNSGTLNLTIDGSTIRETNSTVLSNDNIAIDIDQTATVIVAVTDSTFGGAGGSHLDFTLAGAAVGHATVTGNTMTGTGETVANYLGMNVKIAGGVGTWSCRYNISSNTITGTKQGNAILLNKGGGVGNSNSTLQGTVSGNTIGQAAVAESGASQSSGITVESVGDGGTHTALISNNQIFQYDEQGIDLRAGEDLGVADNTNAGATSGPAAALNVTVTGNTISNAGPNALHGIHLNAGNQIGDNNTICADIGGAGALANNVANGANEANFGSDIRPRQRNASRVQLPGYGGTAFDATAVQTYFTGRNVLTSISAGTNNATGTANDGYVGGGACPQPLAPTVPTLPAVNAVLDEETEKLVARQSQSLVIPGVMITQQPQPQVAGQMDMPRAAQPAPALAPQAVAQQPKAQSEKSDAAQPSKGGEEKSKKGTAGKIGVTTPSAGMFEVNIATLPANDSVTLTFQVTIAATLSPAAANSVSNQGTVTADGGINKVSDDPQTTPPAAGDGNDATVTPIDKFEPSIDIQSSDTTTSQGESVTFTATLMLGTAPANPLPTGTVSFVDTQGDMNPANDEVFCLNAALTVGAMSSTAQCATTNVDAGMRTIAAIYSGDGRYDAATDTVTQTVSSAATPTVTITTDNPDPSNSGQAVTVQFTVTGGVGTPTGNVVVTVSGGAETCMASVATGQCDITLVAAGNRTLTATYSGDGTYSSGMDTEPHVVVPNVTISDATASEASQLATFTVHLNVTSTETVTVNFTTADEPVGPGKAVAGQDYTSNSGSVVFNPGQTLKTISVPVTNDGAGEPDETFLVNLTSATNGNVLVSPADNQAVGTITEANPAGAILISEIRTSGPGGVGNQFVELYNNSDSPVTLNATDASAGYSLVATNNGCAADPVVVGVITNGTVTIPARGHYLFTGSAYSLASSAAFDQQLLADINADANVALFSTSNLANFSSQTRLDAVGFGVSGTGGNCDLLREGTPLNAAQGSTAQHSFFRKLSSGKPQDTGRSVDDFQLVATDASVINGSPSQLGAPGPENRTSPIQRNDKIKASLIDPMQSAGAPPNSVRRFCSPMDPLVEECNPARSQNGTFSIRRRFTNNTGANVEVLRFRLVNVTTGPTPAAGTADLRAISSVQVTGVMITGGGTVTVEGTTLDAPTQALGGGYNSTLSAGTITMAQPLAPGASVVVQFLLGVQQPGAYSFFVNVEAGPPPVGPLPPISNRTAAQPAKEGLNKTGTGRQ